MRSFDVVSGFWQKPTLSNVPPIRAHTVTVVVVVVVDVASRRDTKKNTTHNPVFHCRSFVLQAMAMYFTSCTILDQYAADLSFSKFRFMDSSM